MRSAGFTFRGACSVLRGACRGLLVLVAVLAIAAGHAHPARAAFPDPLILDVPEAPEPPDLLAVAEEDAAFVVPPVAFAPPLRIAQQIQDPAIETVDEMDTRRSVIRESAPAQGQGSGRPWWDSIRDPAIRTVDEQTYGPTKPKEKQWYERINLRGYTQFRINSTLWNDESQAPPYHPGDKSVGPNGEFFIRRCRLIFSGDLSDRLYFYIQPDFASSVPGAQDGAINYTQLRDCYGDVYLTENKVNRVRVGLSKIPFGWENLQSSSNRIPLDRADPTNTAVNSERGMGVFYYWTPEEAQDLYKEVLDRGLKGSGNYGVFGIGVYNGQGASRAQANDSMHFIMRYEVPWKMDNGQIMEAGVQAYTGRYSPYTAPITTSSGRVVPIADPTNGVLDQRVGGTLVYYPQPFGFTTEWCVGDGPQLTDIDQPQPIIRSRPLNGGYVLLNYKIDTEDWGTWFPFFRWQQYRGGYLWERNSPNTFLNEFNMGFEWQIQSQMEFTMEYDFANRTNTGSNARIIDDNYAQFRGDLLRFQFQINY